MLALLLSLTIPAAAASDALAGRAGSVVVMDARTGRVLAAHRAGRVAPPGSVLKPFTLAALLETAGLDPEAPVACERRVRIGPRNFDCAHPKTAQAMRAASALAYSCNFYFARMAARLKPPEFALRLKSVAETRPAASLEQLQLQALGEGDVRVTPLGLAAAYRRLALRLASTPALAPVLEGLQGSTTYGTGRLAALDGIAVAGKTGTAGPHAWFAGFAPARAPQVVVVVFLEQGQGGADAAPIAAELFRRALVRAPSYRVRLLAEGRTISLAPEEYVAGVLAGESSVFRSEEALKAMAVAARTYARCFRGRHSKEGFDFCDTTHCQDFRPGPAGERLARAAEATEGELLWFEGAPAAAFYHRNCGGVTEADPRYPYLRRQPDSYCAAQEAARWRAELSKDEIARALTAAGLRVSGVPRLEVLERSPSGRALTLRAGALRLEASVFHAAIGRALGWNRLRSTLYELRDSGATVVFQGRGFGHGLGLCQAGAQKMGADGKSHRDILAYYFPGATLGVSAQGFRWRLLGAERAEVWTTQPDVDSSLPRLAGRAVAEAERRTGFHLSYRPRFRVYPSVAAFRDATGQPGSVAAVSRGALVRLQPAGVLRARGVLESTLLHEALHQAIESRARPSLPDWFREGLVLVLAGAPPARPYGAAEARVRALVERHGLATVLGWVAAGLPATE